MKTSTQARKIAQVFNDETVLPMELAEQLEILLSYTGFYRLTFCIDYLKHLRTTDKDFFPDFLEHEAYPA